MFDRDRDNLYRIPIPRLMTTMYPREMIEELMFYIMQNEMDGKLDPDHPMMELYINLQHLLDKLDRDRRDMYVSVEKETLSNAVSKDDMSVAIYNDEVKT